jgi:NAD(P)-dependent dehydrogenase (short-subunit alcohol dehydrogenase family)
MAVRDLAKGERVRAALLAEVPAAGLEVRQLDLSSLTSVRAFAADAVRDRPRIDLLVNNAGVTATPPRQTDDGFEWQLGVNHLGHFALTAALLPALLRSRAARVVTVSSAVGLVGRSLREERLAPGPSYHAWLAYADSKLAGYRFARELARRLALAGAPVASLAVHPGLADTDLLPASVRAGGAGPLGRVGMLAARWFGMPASDGVLSVLRAATDPSARNGESYGPRWVMAGPPVRLPTLKPWLGRETVERLWAISEAATGVDYRAAMAGS